MSGGMAISRHHSSQSPILNGLGTPRSESPAVMMSVDSPGRQPPASPRVTCCKNCKFSFRSLVESAEFCSRDCETCYTIFKSNMAPEPEREDPVAIREVKNEIYLFKKQLEMMDHPLPPPARASPSLRDSMRDSPVSMTAGIASSGSIDSPKTAHKKASASRFVWNMAMFRPTPEKNISV